VQVATAPASQPHYCAAPETPTSPTCSANTAPRPPSRNPSA